MHFTKCRNIKRKAAFPEFVKLVEKPFRPHLRQGLLRANVQSLVSGDGATRPAGCEGC